MVCHSIWSRSHSPKLLHCTWYTIPQKWKLTFHLWLIWPFLLQDLFDSSNGPWETRQTDLLLKIIGMWGKILSLCSYVLKIISKKPLSIRLCTSSTLWWGHHNLKPATNPDSQWYFSHVQHIITLCGTLWLKSWCESWTRGINDNGYVE